MIQIRSKLVVSFEGRKRPSIMYVRDHARTCCMLLACSAMFFAVVDNSRLLAQSATQARQVPVVASGYVQLSDNSYRNDLLGFRFKLPAGWVVSTDVAGSASGVPQDLSSSSGSGISPSAVYLMRATPSGAGIAPATLYVMAEDLSRLVDVKNPLSYLVRLNNAMGQQRMKFMGVSGGIVRGANRTYRALYKSVVSEASNDAQYYSMDVTILRGHAVVFVISAKDSGTLDRMEPLLEGIEFLPDAMEKSTASIATTPTPVAAPTVPAVAAVTNEPVVPYENSQNSPALVKETPVNSQASVEHADLKPAPLQTNSAKDLTEAKTDKKPGPEIPGAAPAVQMDAVVPAVPVAPARVTLPEAMMAGYLVSRPPAHYPEFIAASQRVSAVVILKVVISTEGRVRSQQQVRGNNDFVIAAMEAVREWRYKPFLLKGVPVEVETQATVTFKP